MGFNHEYPYMDFHEINLDWILRQIMKLHMDYDEFKAANTITNAGAWDITKQYQTWTIVSDNNAGYISLQPVPAGIAISNTDYWGLIADYDVLITDLSDRISALENQMANLTRRRCIFVSDSYGDRPDNWIQKTVIRLQLDAGDYYSTAVNGAGFKPSYNSYFLTYLQNLTGSVSDPDTITDVVVVGGFNDRSTDPAELAAAISAFCNYVRATYKNAKIWIGAAGWSMNYEFQEELLQGQYVGVYQNCGQYGAKYLSGIDYIMHNFDNFESEDPGGYTLYLQRQFVHPNAAGAELIANAVYSNMTGVPFHYKARKRVPVQLVTGASVSGGMYIQQAIDDDKITVSFEQGTNISFDSQQSCSWMNYKEIGTLASGFAAGASANQPITNERPFLGFLAGGTMSGNVKFPMSFYLANNRLYMRIMGDAVDKFENIFITGGSAVITNVYL